MQYWVPIQYSALTNIFLDNTAALRKKVPASKLFLNRFFLFCWNKVHTYYGSFLFCICYCNIGLPPSLLQQVSLWCCVVTADPRVQPAEVWKCVQDAAHAWYLHIIIAFFIFLTLSHKMTLTHCLSISHAFSITSIFCFTCSAVWDPWNLHIPACCNSKVGSI